jgi:hypothetical protein
MITGFVHVVIPRAHRSLYLSTFSFAMESKSDDQAAQTKLKLRLEQIEWTATSDRNFNLFRHGLTNSILGSLMFGHAKTHYRASPRWSRLSAYVLAWTLSGAGIYELYASWKTTKRYP